MVPRSTGVCVFNAQLQKRDTGDIGRALDLTRGCLPFWARLGSPESRPPCLMRGEARPHVQRSRVCPGHTREP